MKKLRWGFILTLIFVLMSSVHALDIGISPPDVNLQLDRGGTYQGEVYVMGSEKEEVAINSYAMDWSLTTSGDYQFLPKGTLKRSASPWISYTPAQFKIMPGRGQKVRYTVKVPADAVGSYWSVLMFATTPKPPAGDSQFQIAAAARVACIIKVDINGSRSVSGNIERFKLSWDAPTKKVEATIRIKNTGSSFIRFKGRLELKDQQGKIVEAIPFREGLVLPDLSREFVLTDKDIDLKPGFYIGLAIVDLGERSQKAVQAVLNIK